MAEASGNIFGPINAETNDLSQFTSYTIEGSMGFATDADAKNQGSYGFKITGDGANNQADGYITLGSAQSEIYARAYVNIPSDADCATWGAIYFIDLRDATSSIARVGFQFDASGNPLRWAGYLGASSIIATVTNFTTGVWHYVELRYLKDASTGGVQIWVDGTSIVSDLDQATTKDVTIVRLGSTGASSILADDDYFYWDDALGASTGPIGAYSDVAVGGLDIPIAIYHYLKSRHL